MEHKSNKWLKFFFQLLSLTLIINLNVHGDDGVGIYGRGEDFSDISSVNNNNLSVTGTTQTQEVPFSEETLDETKEREFYQPAFLPEQRIIPFQEMPPPIELPESEAPELYKTPYGLPIDESIESSFAPTLGGNFSGLGDNNAGIPPDTMGAVGALHLVETLNTEVAFFNKSTGAIVSQVSLQSFWASLGTGAGEPANFPFDPKVIYDQHSGCFTAVTMGYDSATANSSWLMIAVSATSDPTGTWYKWAIDADTDGGVQTYNNWADYPGFGVDADNVYVTANMFSTADVYQYSKLWVIPKTQLLTGTSTITWTEFRAPSGSGPTMQPVHAFGASSTEYLIHQGYSITGPPLRRFHRISSITFPGGTPTWTDMGYIEVTAYPTDSFPDAPQLGSANLIETNDTRLLSAVLRNGYIWTTHTVANDANTKTEVAWYQINPASASLSAPYGTPTQQGRISDTTRWYYFPSIAVNSNDGVGIGFSGSSTSEYAGAYYTGRQSSDTSGTMQSVEVLKSGLASYYKTFSGSQNRWGDYSATCVDPDDDLTFWTLQEYASTLSGGYDRWGTWWGTFTLGPATPSSLSVSVSSVSQIDLSWTDNSNNETGFKIERKTGASGTYIQIATVGVNVTTYNDTGLSESTTYYYRLRSYNDAGNSDYSNEANTTTLPLAPSELTALTMSGLQIDLTWTDNSSGETGFKIERKTGASGTYSQIGTASADVTTYSDTGLSELTTYYYRVRAYNSVSDSSYSNEANATTLTATPSNLSLSVVSESQIDLSWTDNSSGETGFKIERKTGASGTYSEIATVSTDVVTYNDTGLSEGTTYYYRLRSYNTSGNSAYSSEAGATTLPAAPGNLSASEASGSQIDLTWADNSSGETGFKIERKTGASGTYSQIGTASADATTYSDTGLSELTTYYYRVRAYNASGNSNYSNDASADTILATPSSLSASAFSISQINLTWTDNSLQETGFEIERKTGSDGTYNPIATVSADVTTYADTGLSEGTVYYYRIKAYNASENSIYSNIAMASTLPNTPTSLYATPVSENEIILTWQDNSIGETGFKIERKEGSTGTYNQIATVSANVTSYSDTSADEATTYYYKVNAYTSGGNSSYSNEGTALTYPAAPSGLAAAAVSTSQIDLTWTDNSSGDSGYKIERKTDISGTYNEIGTVGANVITYSSTTLNEATIYYYRISAYNATGNSDYSSEVSATTLPNAPSSLNATVVSNSEIDLTWQDNSIGETGFKIEREEGSTGTYSQIATVSANVTSYNDTSADEATTYYYRVCAYASGDSLYSNEVSVLTLFSAPSGLSIISPYPGNVLLTWTDNSSGETGFMIEKRQFDSLYGYIVIAMTNVNANTTYYAESGLSGGTYYYRVMAYNNSGNYSAYSNEVSIEISTSGGSAGGGGGGCFIATAAYGSMDTKEVRALVQFRDEKLMNNPMGRGFVKVYYRYSPEVAKVVSRNQNLKDIVKLLLKPLVVLCNKG